MARVSLTGLSKRYGVVRAVNSLTLEKFRSKLDANKQQLQGGDGQPPAEQPQQ